MFVDCGGESKVLQDAFAKLEQDKPESERTASPVSLVDEPQILAWEHCPPRMGRYGAKLLTEQLHLHEEPAPLIKKRVRPLIDLAITRGRENPPAFGVLKISP